MGMRRVLSKDRKRRSKADTDAVKYSRVVRPEGTAQESDVPLSAQRPGSNLEVGTAKWREAEIAAIRARSNRLGRSDWALDVRDDAPTDRAAPLAPDTPSIAPDTPRATLPPVRTSPHIQPSHAASASQAAQPDSQALWEQPRMRASSSSWHNEEITADAAPAPVDAAKAWILPPPGKQGAWEGSVGTVQPSTTPVPQSNTNAAAVAVTPAVPAGSSSSSSAVPAVSANDSWLLPGPSTAGDAAAQPFSTTQTAAGPTAVNAAPPTADISTAINSQQLPNAAEPAAGQQQECSTADLLGMDAGSPSHIWQPQQEPSASNPPITIGEGAEQLPGSSGSSGSSSSSIGADAAPRTASSSSSQQTDQGPGPLRPWRPADAWQNDSGNTSYAAASAVVPASAGQSLSTAGNTASFKGGMLQPPRERSAGGPASKTGAFGSTANSTSRRDQGMPQLAGQQPDVPTVKGVAAAASSGPAATLSSAAKAAARDQQRALSPAARPSAIALAQGQGSSGVDVSVMPRAVVSLRSSSAPAPAGAQDDKTPLLLGFEGSLQQKITRDKVAALISLWESRAAIK